LLSSVSSLLTTWRQEVLCITKSDLARMLAGPNVEPDTWITNLSRYESLSSSSHRNPNREVLRQIDDCAGAGGALEDLARAISTPKIFRASRSWAHNFQGQSRPVWIWIRFPDTTEKREAQLRCGNISAQVEIPAGESGIFVTSEYSAPNPPILAELSQPGWVNFGRGDIPSALGVKVVRGFEIMRKTSRLLKFMEVIAKSTISDGELKDNAASFVGLSRGPDQLSLDSETDGVAIVSDYEWPSHVRFSQHERCDFRNLRLSELLSVEQVARLATRMDPSLPLRESTLIRFEQGVRVKEWRSIQQRLDVIYAADGRAANVLVQRESGSADLNYKFPDFWIGPVWVSFAIPLGSKGSVVQLKWGGWQRMLTVDEDVTVSFRKSQDGSENFPLGVVVPLDWLVQCGTGRLDGSVDLNDGWVPNKVSFLNQKFNEIRAVLGRSNEDHLPFDPFGREVLPPRDSTID